MNTESLLWLAGLLEGEGSFTSAHRQYAEIDFGSVDYDIVEKVASLFESTIQEKKPANDARIRRQQRFFATRITGERAAELARRLAPIMGKRRQEQIRHMLELGGYS